MKPESEAMLRSLLRHHRFVCVDQGLTSINDCTTTYGAMCADAGVPHLIRHTGPFLYEVAEWCQARKLPPINSLVVLENEWIPGDSYGEAPGCTLAGWVREVEDCIGCRRYPEEP